jgi:hypothetical protein
MPGMTRCHCGKPLHYTDPVLERHMHERVRVLGELVTITVDGRSWAVPRHYVALHGLNVAALPTLGFVEGFTCPSCHITSFAPDDVESRYCSACHYLEGRHPVIR